MSNNGTWGPGFLDENTVHTNQSTNKDLFLCNYTPSERQQHIIARIAQYHKNCDRAEKYYCFKSLWLSESTALHKWRKENGYTQEEYQQAKKDYWQMKYQI